MISDMIPLRGKYFQIPRLIIQTVSVFMVDNIAGFKRDMFRYSLPCKSLALPGLFVRSLLRCFKVSVVTFYRAMQAFTITHLAAWAGEGLAASLASNFKRSVFGGVDSITLEQLPESLPGPAVSFSKLDQRDQVDGVGGDDVNFLFRCQSISHDSASG